MIYSIFTLLGSPESSTADEISTLKCNLCDYAAENTSLLKQHYTKVHKKTAHPCDQCDYIALLSSTLKRHIESVLEGRRYTCVRCDYSVPEMNKLRIHMKTHRDRIGVNSIDSGLKSQVENITDSLGNIKEGSSPVVKKRKYKRSLSQAVLNLRVFFVTNVHLQQNIRTHIRMKQTIVHFPVTSVIM